MSLAWLRVFVVTAFGPHLFLRFNKLSSGLIDFLVPECCWVILASHSNTTSSQGNLSKAYCAQRVLLMLQR